jgi:hypothetical protein
MQQFKVGIGNNVVLLGLKAFSRKKLKQSVSLSSAASISS